MSLWGPRVLVYTLCLCIIWYLSFKGDIVDQVCIIFSLYVFEYIWIFFKKNYFSFAFIFSKDFGRMLFVNSHKSIVVHYRKPRGLKGSLHMLSRALILMKWVSILARFFFILLKDVQN